MMKMHTYHAGAKPVIERLLASTGETGAIRPDLKGVEERNCSRDEFDRYIEEAIERCRRHAASRRQRRRELRAARRFEAQVARLAVTGEI